MDLQTTIRDFRPMIDKRVRKYIEESDVFVYGVVIYVNQKGIEVKTTDGRFELWQHEDCEILDN